MSGFRSNNHFPERSSNLFPRVVRQPLNGLSGQIAAISTARDVDAPDIDGLSILWAVAGREPSPRNAPLGLLAKMLQGRFRAVWRVR
jgi:hypothetical protein